jgi:hypothetical protein
VEIVSNYLPDDIHFERLAGALEADQPDTHPSLSRLKAKIYSSLTRQQEKSGPLMGLQETKDAGSGLCVFEELVRISPVGEKAKSFNCCRLCHARLLAEQLEKAPIYWGGCPYVDFQKP